MRFAKDHKDGGDGSCMPADMPTSQLSDEVEKLFMPNHTKHAVDLRERV